MKITSSREDFFNSWVTKIPKNIMDDGQLISRIENFDYPIIELGNGYFAKKSEDIAYYWHGYEKIDTAIEILVRYQTVITNCIFVEDAAKMVELCRLILKDEYNAIRMGVDMLSDIGKYIWMTLIPLGYSIFVYHQKSPGATMQTIKTVIDMEHFLKQYEGRYQFWDYVLCDNSVKSWETRSRFLSRSIWEDIENDLAT